MYFGPTIGIHNFNKSQRHEVIDAWAMAKAKTLIEDGLWNFWNLQKIT